MYRPIYKIIHITQAFGGVKTYIDYILTYSNCEKFQYVVVAPKDEEFQKFCAQKGIYYYPVPLKRNFNPIADMISVFRIALIIKKEKPNLIHLHSAKAGFIGRLAGKIVRCKIIYTPHAFSYLSFTGFKRVVFYLLEYISRNWSDLLLPVSYSEANRAFFELGYRRDKVEVFLNSISPPKQFVPKDYNSNFRIGMIGRLTYQKDPLVFLAIASKLIEKYPLMQFSLLGAGLHDHLRLQVETYIVNKNLSNNVQILQWGDSSTSSEFLNKTDIYVMTSAFEGLPFSLLEAMGQGIPCVVTVADGNSDVIEDSKNGFICLSLANLTNKIEMLVNSLALRRFIGENGKQYVFQKHNIETNIIRLQGIYSKIIDYVN